ncbi:EAL domain-containing protein [Aliamphritea spongicola]|uniref:EAL domain-containing protein n=1 Tax=Aliamphritea spongicola TaxID=707589 RepID=UPI00196AB07B|nr:EAL domain-containing protein [Aliamphritea spongicola]
MKSLQSKIFTFFVLLLLLVQGVAFWTLYAGNQNQQKQEISNRLTTAKTVFTELFSSRIEYLAAFAETVSKDYGIKQVFNEDQRSLLVALNNHRKRINADLAMTVSAEGVINAQLVSAEEDDGGRKVRRGDEVGAEFRYPGWLKNPERGHLYAIGKNVYQLSLSPVKVGAKTIGWVVFGFQVDGRLATEFMTITGLETDFIVEGDAGWWLVASSSPTADVKFSGSIINGDPVDDQYIVVGHQISEDQHLRFGVAMYGLRANFVEVLQEQWWKLLILAVGTLVLSLAGAYWISASITRPVKRLVQQAKIVASGDYNQTIKLDDQSELGQLADEINLMQDAVLSREQALSHRANHDPLTDLPNRNFLKIILDSLCGQEEAFGVIQLNLSRLKDVNDTLGHQVGDYVIQALADRLRSVQGFQLVCHLGADEFVVLTENCPLAEAESCVQRCLDNLDAALEPVFDYQGLGFQLQVRSGVSLYPQHSKTPDSLLRMSDIALHHTRATSQQVQWFAPELDVNSVERLNLINDLKQAISGDQLVLFYQPKLNLQSRVVTHVEALVRWIHPTMGMVPPDNFIHIAEQTGQINALTRWVIRTALNQYNEWRAEGLDLGVAINISAANLKDPDFYGFLCETIQELAVPAEKITLEVTESAVVEDPESAITLLSRFKDWGMRISIDDYGTGYSSLAQLKQLPVHELKIDKSFIQRLSDDQSDQIIVKSTIELAHSMGLSVVAEGIEDEFALDWLTSNNCELAQGYHISRPQAVDALTPWLKDHAQLNPREEAC